MQLIKDKAVKSFNTLKGDFGYTNQMAAPKIEKVVVSSGFGSAKDRKGRLELISDRLTKITGQKPTVRIAKKSIASFKVREGDPTGLAVTLRGERMYAFLEKFFNIAVPRMRDFRGFDKKGIDEIGNYTIGLTENTIFPETSDEDLKDVFGMSITIVTSAKIHDEAEKFLELIGVPFKKA